MKNESPFSSNLLQKIQADPDGTERKRILDLLEKWKEDFSHSQLEGKPLMEDILNLAIKMVQEVSTKKSQDPSPL